MKLIENGEYRVVKINAEQHKELKIIAIQQGKTLQDIINEMIEDYLRSDK